MVFKIHSRGCCRSNFDLAVLWSCYWFMLQQCSAYVWRHDVQTLHCVHVHQRTFRIVFFRYKETCEFLNFFFNCISFLWYHGRLLLNIFYVKMGFMIYSNRTKVQFVSISRMLQQHFWRYKITVVDFFVECRGDTSLMLLVYGPEYENVCS